MYQYDVKFQEEIPLQKFYKEEKHNFYTTILGSLQL